MANRKGVPRSESAFHEKLTKEDREDLLKLQTLRDLPKSRYATRSCVTGIPLGRGRKAVYSHIEVYKMVEDIATDLREAGVRPQTPCAYVLENGIEAVIYFLSLQWIGAIAVPIDPKLSASDIASVLQEVKAATLVSADVDEDEQDENELFQKLKEACNRQEVIHWFIRRSTNRGVFVDRKGIRAGEEAAWAGGAADFKYDPNEKCLRYAVGEEGQFLLVELSHRGAAEATREFSKTYSLRAEDSTIIASDIHTMQGLMTVLATIYSGGNVVILEGPVGNVSKLLQHAAENKVTWISAEHTMVQGMYDEVEQDNLLKERLNLSFVRSYGGNIHVESLVHMEPMFRAPVLEAYGTPETCGLVSSNREYESKPGTCGKAIHGCEILVWDLEKDSPVPANTEGRIAVRGPHITMYYIANDYANEACFVELLEGENSGYYFLTGDLGYLTEESFLTITQYNQPEKRAASLSTQKEEEVKSKRDFEAMRQAQIREEELRRVAEASMLEEKRRKEEEEAKRLEEERKHEEERKKEEEKKLEEARKLEEERIRKEEELAKEKKRKEEEQSLEEERRLQEQSSGRSGSVLDTDELHSVGNRSHTSVPVEVVREVTKVVETERIPDELVDKIMLRLDQIEDNQRRLEREIEHRHREEMEKLRDMIEKLEADREQQVLQSPKELEEIRNAMQKAAASAESSSRDTAAAAQAAKEAAESAKAAAVVKEGNNKNFMEIKDPGSLQKTILVSLEDVDMAMRTHAAIQAARAFGRPDPRYGAEVFCAVCPKKGARVSEPWLMLHAQSMLPAAFVPKKFFFVDGLSNMADRAELSANTSMKRISELSGYVSDKKVKSPKWTPSSASTRSK